MEKKDVLANKCIQCNKSIYEDEMRVIVEDEYTYCLDCFHKNFTDINVGES